MVHAHEKLVGSAVGYMVKVCKISNVCVYSWGTPYVWEGVLCVVVCGQAEHSWLYQFGNDYTSCYSVVGTCTHSMTYSDLFTFIQLYMQLYYVCAVLVARMIWCMHGLLC